MTKKKSKRLNGFDWYDTLTEEQQGMWFENLQNQIEKGSDIREFVEDFLNDYYATFRDFLMLSFIWEDSNE
jgi:hypothetical protein